MDNLDLDIKNYNVNELLGLFNLDYTLTDDDIKKAYKQTLMTHPDKSGLQKEYFLFFSKAFKKLKYLYDYKQKYKESQKCPHENEEEYKNILESEFNRDKKQQEEIQKKIKATNNFNDKFNKLFEEVRIYDEEQDTGYDEWMKSNPVNDENINITNTRSMNEFIEKKKKEARSMIVYDGVKEMNSSLMMGNNSNIKREKPQYYESGLFSKMQYEDYKRAHSETVIPVTYEDYLNKEKFNSVDEMMKQRKTQETMPSLEQSNSFLEQKNKLEKEESMDIAYNLTQQLENIENSKKIWNSNFNLLLDK